MNQYQKTTEKKKQAIIQAALRLFKDKGFKETSIKSIAEAAEVSPVSIYNYFGGKDNLVALCVNDLFEEITQQAEDILKSNQVFYKSSYSGVSDRIKPGFFPMSGENESANLGIFSR